MAGRLKVGSRRIERCLGSSQPIRDSGGGGVCGKLMEIQKKVKNELGGGY